MIMIEGCVRRLTQERNQALHKLVVRDASLSKPKNIEKASRAQARARDATAKRKGS